MFTKAINDVIKEHGKLIAGRIIQKFPDTSSVFLIGAMAKGEGGLVKHGNVVSPVNDYDVYFVSEKQAKSDVIKRLEAICANDVKNSIRKKYTKEKIWKDFDRIVSEITVDIRRLEDNFTSLPLLRFYEMKRISMVIYGKDVRNMLPDVKGTALMIPDGLKLLFNEMTHLIEFIDERKINGRLSYSERFMVDYFTAKIYSAVCTALLIKSGNIQLSIIDRVKKLKKIYAKEFPSLHEKVPDLPKTIEENVKIRMDSRFLRNGTTRTKKIENLIRDMDIVLRFYLKSIIEIDGDNWSDITDAVTKNLWKVYYRPYIEYKLKSLPLTFLTGLFTKLASMRLNMIYSSRCAKSDYKIPIRNVDDYGTAIMSLLFILFFSMPVKGMSSDLICLLSKYGINIKTWNMARAEYIKIYRSYYWQKIL